MQDGLVPLSTGPGLPGFRAPLLSVVRDALRSGGGRVALRVPALTPHRQRVARALLQEGALSAGGTVVDGPNDELLLIGAEAARAERLRGLLDRLLGGAITGLWSLDRDGPALLAYASGAGGGTAERDVAPDLAGLDAWLRQVALHKVVARQLGLKLENGVPRPDFLRLGIARPSLRALLGLLGRDADVLDHAQASLEGRLLQAMGDAEQRRQLIGPHLPGPLHLPVPPTLPSGAGGTGGRSMLVATVGLEQAANPSALTLRRAGLAAQGWGLEVEGLDAASLPLLVAEAIPADLLRLRWSPGLATPTLTEAVRRLDPARVILAGVEDQQALDWGVGAGLRRMEGRFLEARLMPPRPMLAAGARLPIPGLPVAGRTILDAMKALAP